jgi:hypothetical protein
MTSNHINASVLTLFPWHVATGTHLDRIGLGATTGT